MGSVAKAPISTGAKVFVVLALVLGTLNMIDYLFYGKEIRNLLAAIGFALMGYGIYKNDLRSARAARDHATIDRGARYGVFFGIALVLASYVIRWLA